MKSSMSFLQYIKLLNMYSLPLNCETVSQLQNIDITSCDYNAICFLIQLSFIKQVSHYQKKKTKPMTLI